MWVVRQIVLSGGMVPHKEDELAMALLINSYSFVALGLLSFLVMTLLTWRLVNPTWAAAIAAVTFVFLVAFQLMASTKANTVSSPEDFNNALTYGEPILLELYSNF